eukprot:SAG11_NODE_784_length_7187_cov_2.920429_8_plen_263_part_00
MMSSPAAPPLLMFSIWPAAGARGRSARRRPRPSPGFRAVASRRTARATPERCRRRRQALRWSCRCHAAPPMRRRRMRRRGGQEGGSGGGAAARRRQSSERQSSGMGLLWLGSGRLRLAGLGPRQHKARRAHLGGARASWYAYARPIRPRESSFARWPLVSATTSPLQRPSPEGGALPRVRISRRPDSRLFCICLRSRPTAPSRSSPLRSSLPPPDLHAPPPRAPLRPAAPRSRARAPLRHPSGRARRSIERCCARLSAATAR